jgi:ribosome-associated translation inhibitor RaiA
VNKDLYGKHITLTEKMKNYLESCFNKAKGAVKELKDIREIKP